MRPVLVVVGGLPATGKSTVASALAREMQAPYLRVDRIEQAIVTWSPLVHPVGSVGYAVAHELAAEQLALGLDVIVECVNTIALTRDGWAEAGRAAGAAVVVEVELICSNAIEHQHRVETRISDVESLTKPTWPEVLGREYEPWNRAHLAWDTFAMPIDKVGSSGSRRRLCRSDRDRLPNRLRGQGRQPQRRSPASPA